MKKLLTLFTIPIISFVVFSSTGYSRDTSSPLIIDHNSVNLALIPGEWITKAKDDLHIAYGHTSHGSQLIDGMTGLVSFKGSQFAFGSGINKGSLDIRDTPFTDAFDLGNPDFTAWESATRKYLSGNSIINVIIWSWCGEASYAAEKDIETYLSLMSGLEKDFPNISFVYMTGHLDGTGLNGNLHARNEQIRNFCKTNNKILYDFNDIESYNPDGKYFGDKIPNDNCDYDTNGDGERDGNWAIEWQNANPGKWFDCSSAHSQPLNANLKAYAAWSLCARLAGWTDVKTDVGKKGSTLPKSMMLKQNNPNPFNSTTTIGFNLVKPEKVEISIYNINGQHIATLCEREFETGNHTIIWNGRDRDGITTTSGCYVYRLVADSGVTDSKKMLFLK
jgi:hypothetical protein